MLRSNPVDPDPRVEKEAGSLVAAGHRVTVVGWDRESDHPPVEVAELELASGAVPRWLIGVKGRFGSGLSNVKALVGFERALCSFLKQRSDQFDCIHACDLDTGLVAKEVARRFGKLLVYDVFDYYADSHAAMPFVSSILSSLEDSVINFADATIVCTEQRCEQIAGANPRRLAIIENSPSSAGIPPFAGRRGAKSEIRLAYVGVFADGRYIEELLDAVSNFGDFRLDIAGFGRWEGLVRKKTAACGRVLFHGKVPYSRALELEASSDVMVALYDPAVANHRMAAPNKFYESMMLGVPLVTVKGTSVGEWVERFGTGVAISSDFDGQEFYDAVIRLRDENIDGALTRRGRAVYDELFSWDVMSKRLVDLYADIEMERSS